MLQSHGTSSETISADFCQGNIGVSISLDQTQRMIEIECEIIQDGESSISLIRYDIDGIRSGCHDCLIGLRTAQQGYYAALHEELLELNDELESARSFSERFTDWKRHEDPIIRSIAYASMKIDAWWSRLQSMNPKEMAVASFRDHSGDAEIHRFMSDFYGVIDTFFADVQSSADIPSEVRREIAVIRNGIDHICDKIDAVRSSVLKIAEVSRGILETNYPTLDMEVHVRSAPLRPVWLGLRQMTSR